MFPRLTHTGLKADDFNDLAGVLSAWKSTGLLRSEPLTRAIAARMEIKLTSTAVKAIAEDTGHPRDNVSIQGSRKQDNPPPEPARWAGPAASGGVVGHRPLTMLASVRRDAGHWIMRRVLDEHGRDAIGATVTVRAGGRTASFGPFDANQVVEP